MLCVVCDAGIIVLYVFTFHSNMLLLIRLVFLSEICDTHTHTHPFNGPLSGTTWVGRYQKGKTNLDFTEARDSEWQ